MEKKRIRITVAYDGTNYHGWQLQENGITIEEELNRCLTELLGEKITEADGTSYEGIGLAGFSTVHGETRLAEDVYGHTDLYPEAVVGFVNKCGVITGVETPLLTRVEHGVGNAGRETPEGFHWRNVFASELTGPILVKNPKLLEAVAAAVYARRGERLPENRAADDWAERGYAVTEEELRRRFARK